MSISNEFEEDSYKNSIENFIKKRVDHRYNQENFKRQLTDEVDKNLFKLEKESIKELKRKLALQQKSKEEANKIEQIKQERALKEFKSKKTRENNLEHKLSSMISERSFRRDLFLERIGNIRKKEEDDLSRKIQKIQQKQLKNSQVKINPLGRSVSLLSDPLYMPTSDAISNISQKRQNYYKQFSLSNQYNSYGASRLQEMILKKNQLSSHKRQLSLRQFENPSKYTRLSQNEEGRNQENGGKGQQPQRKRPKHSYSYRQLPLRSEQEKLEDVKTLQEERKKYLMSKLKQLQQKKEGKNALDLASKMQPLKQLKTESSRISMSNSRNKTDIILSPTKNSILFEQSPQRQKHSYRKQIISEIKEYIKKQKQEEISQS